MKKEYVSPAIDVMRVETLKMIATSLEKTTETLGDSDEGYFLGRESDWDE